MRTIHEPARSTPVADTCDVCVIGGSCTGVFAAVRAAQLGAKVCLIEGNGVFGGVATAGLVNVWHSLHDTTGNRQIIAGLTQEIIERLERRDAVVDKGRGNIALNPAELVLELDALVCSQPRVRPFLHTRFVQPVVEDGRVTAVILEDKSGRRAVVGDAFIDATGDGDVAHRAGLPTRTLDDLQPPTTAAILHGLAEVGRRNAHFSLSDTVHDTQYPEALKEGFLWHTAVPGLPDAHMVAGTRAHNADCSDADQLTQASLDTRRQVRSMCDLLRRHIPGGDCVHLAAVSTYIGIRETRHVDCLHRLTEDEVLRGEDFPDAIANGTYPVDVHHSNKPGITFRYLDGREAYVAPGRPRQESRWRPETTESPTFYQIPYRSLVPRGARNVLVAGRLIDVDRGAFGAVRVMVNCNQTGEAAGVAAWLARDTGRDVADVDTDTLREKLAELGALII